MQVYGVGTSDFQSRLYSILLLDENVYRFSGKLFQSMIVLSCSRSSSLHFEKCLQPRNPRCADRGDGWGA